MTTDPVDLTRRLIQFDTINPPGNESACARHLGDLLAESGFAVEYHEMAPGRASVIARLGGGTPLCLTGHLDTVPLGAAPWTVDPFAGAVKDGRIWGRGASDMKAGVAAITAAALAERDVSGNGRGVILVFTAGEETGCEGAFHLAHDGVLGAAGAVIVAEPTANAPYVGHKGALWFKARTRGVTAHGSMPDKGVNALYKAARAVTKLEEFDFNVARHPVMGGPTLNVGTMASGLNVNSVPDLAEVGVDIRTVPGIEHARLLEQMQSYLGTEVDIEALVNVGPVWTDPAHPWIGEVFATVAAIAGTTPKPETATYFTDAAALVPAFGAPPTVILGPGEPSMAHKTDEWCDIALIHQAVEIYRQLIRTWG